MFEPETLDTRLGETCSLTLGAVIRLADPEKRYWAATSEGAQSAHVAAHSLLEYLRVFGLKPSQNVGANFSAFLLITKWVEQTMERMPAFFHEKGRLDEKEYLYDYEGRGMVVWVHQLAREYHWHEDDILDLPVLRAAHYLQEIKLSTYEEMEWQRSLSEVAYEYKNNKTRYVPMRKPKWMKPVVPEEKQVKKVPKSLLPAGVKNTSGYTHVAGVTEIPSD